jgi:outer membrane cobalamin receptor
VRLTIVCIISLLTSCGVWSQPVKTLDTIVILPKSLFSEGGFSISGRLLDRVLLPDVGSIVQRIPGYQVKNYGDVGGLKLASFRGLGANHTSIVVDNQAASVAQSGSTDLSNLPTEFVRSIETNGPLQLRTDMPISSKMNGSALYIQTWHSPFTYQSHAAVKLSAQQGSFGLWSSEMALFVPVKKWQFALSGKARRYEGAFPYRYQNGNQTIKAVRKNNALTDLYGTASVNVKLSPKHRLHALIAIEDAKKQLPGAVVFYNETANTHLSTSLIRAQLLHQFSGKSSLWTTQINAHRSQLHYVDSNYLNSIGYLEMHYPAQELNGESQFSYFFEHGTNLLIGSSLKYEGLKESTLISDPARVINQHFLQIQQSLFHSKVKVQINQGATVVADEQADRTKSYYLPQGMIFWQVGHLQSILLSAKRTMRLPTFSELYFQSVLPNQLRPEIAEQLSVKWIGSWKKGLWSMDWSIEPFLTNANDKIVAIPTQNTFIWSIVNIAKSRNTGVENYLSVHFSNKKKTIDYQFSGNYTYQSCVDLSNEQASNYGHQISYAPQHTGNIDFTMFYKTWSIFLASSYIGNRYALPENIATNELPAILQFDAGMTKAFPFKKQLLRVSAVVRNLTNVNNQYIRYFVLPGIHYQVKLSYEIFPTSRSIAPAPVL